MCLLRGTDWVFKCNLGQTYSLWVVPWRRRLIAGLSLRILGFGLRSVHVRFVVDAVALGQVFLPVLLSPLSVSFHRSAIPFFIYMLLLPGGQRNVKNNSAVSVIEDCWTVSPFTFSLDGVKVWRSYWNSVLTKLGGFHVKINWDCVYTCLTQL